MEDLLIFWRSGIFRHYLPDLCLYPRCCPRSTHLAAPLLGPACDLPSGRSLVSSLPGCGCSLREPLAQKCSTSVADIDFLCLPYLCSTAGTSQGELKSTFVKWNDFSDVQSQVGLRARFCVNASHFMEEVKMKGYIKRRLTMALALCCREESSHPEEGCT